MPPRENGLGVPGQAASNAQHLQNVRQQGAKYRGQQIYNDPTTHAGREAQAAWLKNNPIPQQSIDTVYGGVNYGNKLQKDTEVAVDQEQIARGGPGTGNAMIRAGMLDANGYKPNTPGVNTRDTRSESAQHAQHNQVMADIKREGAEARARGEQFQPKGVNVINPSNRVDISGERRKLEIKNGEPKFSRDEGGVNYAGPKKLPAPLAAPTPAPVAQATPAPTGYQWKSKEAEKLYNDAVNKPGSGYNGNVNMGGGSLGGAAAQRPQISSLPGAQQTTAELQASGQMAPRPAGRYGMTDEQWFNTPEGQKQAQAMKDTHTELLKDGKIGPRPDPSIQAGIAPPMGSTQSGGFGSGRAKPPPIGGPVGDTSFGGVTVAPTPEEEQEKLNQRAREMLAKPRPSDASLEKQAKAHEASLYAKPKPAPKKPPSTPISREINFQERTPNSAEMMEDRRSRAYTGNSGADKIRDNVPEFGESFGAQQVRPKSENEKLPTIKKSSPITDTIKASNTPIPEANPPKPIQQPTQQRKPLFPRLGGRLRK